MNGQWIGSYSGTNTGSVVADLDDARNHYAGVVFAYDHNINNPRTCALVEIPKDRTTFSSRISLAHVHRGSGLVLTLDDLAILPQQSISSVTNVDDLETYVAEFEKRAGKSYLSAIDLPVGERRTVMQDLALMGITAGSLFPGLDGACLQLKERYFDL